MSDQQIENAAKAMVAEGLRCGDCINEEEPSDCPDCHTAALQSARAAAPLIRADLEQEVARLTERVRELEGQVRSLKYHNRLMEAELNGETEE